MHYVLLLLVMVLPATAFCHKEFIVTGVKVDEVANNSVVAKEIALKKADIQAFFMLECAIHNSITLDASNLPSYPKIAQSIKKFQIKHEQISPTRYKATLNYYFDSNKVTELLSNLKLKKYDNNYDKVLIIPIFNAINPELWETVWFNTWQNFAPDYHYLLPIENLSNVLFFKAAEIFKYSNLDLQKLCPQSKIDEVLIISATYKNAHSLAVTVQRPISQQQKTLNFVNLNGDSDEKFMTEIVSIILQNPFRDLQSKQVSLSLHNDEYCQISIPGTEDIHEIKKIIHDLRYIVIYISTDVIVIEIRDNNNIKSAEQALENAGYEIKKLSKTQWHIQKN